MAEKSINVKFTPRDIGRGEWGSKFYIATFRFPLTEAQKFERRAQSLGLTMSSLMNQLVMGFNKSVNEPKGKLKLERTAHPTIWGADAKKAHFKQKGLKVPVKRADAKVGKKPVKVKVSKQPQKVKAAKAKKVVTAKPVKKAVTGAASVLARLKAMRSKSEAA